MMKVTSGCNCRAEALTEEEIGPSMALATAAALDFPVASMRMRRGAGIVRIPLGVGHSGISVACRKKRLLSSIVFCVRSFKRVGEGGLVFRLLKAMWAVCS